MKYTEVERKYALPDPDLLIGRLTDLGGTPAQAVHQIDSYFNTPHRDFLGPEVISEWLRLREEPGKNSINYKRWLPEGATVKTHCDEYESAVADIEALRRMFAALDFTPLVVVDKVRQEWRLNDVLVAVDQVADLGSYVEFEFGGDAQTVEDALDRLGKFVATVGIELGEPLNHGYPHLLLGRAK